MRLRATSCANPQELNKERIPGRPSLEPLNDLLSARCPAVESLTATDFHGALRPVCIEPRCRKKTIKLEDFHAIFTKLDQVIPVLRNMSTR